MSGQDWLTPAAAPAPSSYEQLTAAPGNGTSGHQLRPLTLSEILDRTFSMYKSRFWLFCGISAVGGTLLLLIEIAQLTIQHAWRGVGPQRMMLVSGGVSVVHLFVLFIAYGVTQSATVYALSAVYLGRPVRIGDSLKVTMQHWFRYVLISIWQYFSFLWVPLALLIPAIVLLAIFATGSPAMSGVAVFAAGLAMLVGFPIGTILGIRNLLAVQASVDEQLGARAAMRRSKQLSKGAKGRIFVVLLIWAALYFVVGMLEMPLALAAGFAIAKGGEAVGAQAVLLVVNFLAHAVVFPVGLIGLSLVYFDQRVRKEAYDLELLMANGAPVAPVAPLSYASVPPVVEAPVVAEPEKWEPQAPDERSL